MGRRIQTRKGPRSCAIHLPPDSNRSPMARRAGDRQTALMWSKTRLALAWHRLAFRVSSGQHLAEGHVHSVPEVLTAYECMRIARRSCQRLDLLLYLEICLRVVDH